MNILNLWTGIVMLGIGIALIWVGRPDRTGMHPKFLQFNAALVLYPPVILVFLAFGATAIISSLLAK
jgi:hypothetical protein